MIVIHPSKVQIMSLITNILAYKTSEADTSGNYYFILTD